MDHDRSAGPQGPDAESWARALAGDADAFGRLYGRHAPMVHAVLISRVAAADVDDLLQEVFVAAWRGLDGLREPARLGAWLATIARRAAARHLERSPPRPEPLPEVVDARAGEPDRRAEADELLRVLRELPEAYRETLALRVVEGLSGPEIAELTGLAPASVRTNLSRGLALLRERLARRGWS